jgi:hypothetical protein
LKVLGHPYLFPFDSVSLSTIILQNVAAGIPEESMAALICSSSALFKGMVIRSVRWSFFGFLGRPIALLDIFNSAQGDNMTYNLTSYQDVSLMGEFLPILCRPIWADYSYRNATMGSTRLARFAGR